MKTARITGLILFASLVFPSLGQDLPAGEGRETLLRVCTVCHDLQQIPHMRRWRSEWANIVFKMQDKGAEATDAEFDQIVDYLAKNFAKKTNVNSAPAKELEVYLGFSTRESELIVEYRMKNGKFKDVNDLLKVEEVDAAKIQAASDKIEF